MNRFGLVSIALLGVMSGGVACADQASAAAAEKTVVLHAAHLLDVAAGKLVSPGEVLVRGNRIVEAGASVSRTLSNCQRPSRLT